MSALTDLGRNVRSLRLAAGLTQQELADRADITWVYVSGIERGKVNPSLKIIEKLSTAFGLEAWELLKSCKPTQD